MADNQLTSQIISEVESQLVGSQRASQVISEVEEQHTGSQRASQIIAEVEWRFPHPTVNALVFFAINDNVGVS